MTTPEQAQALGARAERRMQAKIGGYVPGMVVDAAEQEELPPDTIDDGEDDPTEALRAEITKLKQDLAAANGRAGPAQRDLETYRQLALELQRNLEAQRAELEQLRAAKPAQEFDPASVLDPEELDEIDPLVLKVMGKIAAARTSANASVEAEVARVLEQRQQKELQDYREQALLSRDLSDIVTLKSDPNFIAWAEQEDNDVESVVTMLLGASTKPAIDKYARLLKRKIDSYRDSIKAPSGQRSASDATTSIAAGMRRKQTSQLAGAELDKRLAQARRLARSRSAEDRKKASTILNSLGG